MIEINEIKLELEKYINILNDNFLLNGIYYNNKYSNEGLYIYICHNFIGIKYYCIDYFEKGTVNNQIKSRDINEIYYYFAETFTFKVASKYESNLRIVKEDNLASDKNVKSFMFPNGKLIKIKMPTTDTRRIIFSKQIEYMKLINYEWSLKLEKEINNILKKHPYNDNL